MRSVFLAMAALAAAASFAQPVAAQTAGDRDDVRCILMLTAVSRDPKQTEDAAKGTFYYLGRLDSHGLGGKLGPLMVAEAKTIQNAAQAQMEFKRCAAELKGRGDALGVAFQQVRSTMQPKAAPAAAPKKK